MGADDNNLPKNCARRVELWLDGADGEPWLHAPQRRPAGRRGSSRSETQRPPHSTCGPLQLSGACARSPRQSHPAARKIYSAAFPAPRRYLRGAPGWRSPPVVRAERAWMGGGRSRQTEARPPPRARVARGERAGGACPPGGEASRGRGEGEDGFCARSGATAWAAGTRRRGTQQGARMGARICNALPATS